MIEQFRHFALFSIIVTGFLSIPWQVWERREDIVALYERIIAPAQITASPYLVAPGNRTSCDMWIAHQSDSLRAKWIVKCVGGKRV